MYISYISHSRKTKMKKLILRLPKCFILLRIHSHKLRNRCAPLTSADDAPPRVSEEKMFVAFLPFFPPALLYFICCTFLARETSRVYGLAAQHHLMLSIQKADEWKACTILHPLPICQSYSPEGDSGFSNETSLLLLVRYDEILHRSDIFCDILIYSPYH